MSCMLIMYFLVLVNYFNSELRGMWQHEQLQQVYLKSNGTLNMEP